MSGFIGFVLVAVGGLIAALSGLCTIGSFFIALTDGTAVRDLPSILSLGGIPTAIGIGMCFLGLRLAGDGDDSGDRRG